MADDPKFEDDEYHFSDTEGTPSSESLESKPISEGSTALRRNAIIVIGLIVVVLAVYKLLGIFFEPNQIKKVNQTLPPAESKNIIQQPAAFSPPVEQPQPNSQATTTTTTTTTTALEQKLSQLEIASESTKSDINALNTSVTELKTGLNDLTNKISELNSTILSLTTQVQQQQEQMANLKRKPKHHKVVAQKHWGGYFIQAIIAGRAWLKSVNGTTLTVSEGSKIGGLGVVKSIDPRRGEVRMSSGEIIRFSASDR